MKCIRVDGCDFVDCLQRLHFGSEQKVAIRVCVIQRLYSKTIPRQIQLSFVGIPNGRCEHPIQSLKSRDTISFKQTQYYLGIRFREKMVILGLELTPQFSEIEHFSVINNP